jgi:D-alanyl-D-alanine carboxypeptidase
MQWVMSCVREDRMNRRMLIGSGAAVLLAAPAFGQNGGSVPKALVGPWTGGHVGTNGRVPVLVVMQIGIAGNGDVTYRSTALPAGAKGFATARADGTLQIDFEPGRNFAGAVYKARFAGPDRIDGVYARGDGFVTEVALLRGDLPIKELPGPALTQKGLEQTLVECGAPALAAIAWKTGKPMQQWQAGVRKEGAGVKVGPNDVWALGRITMPMTATLAARLVEKGVIRWTDTVGDVLGKVAPQMQEAYKSADLRDLLSHRASLPGGLPVIELGGFPATLAQAPAARDLYAQRVLKQSPVGALRTTEARPSFAGYILAGQMLEKAAGRAYETLMAAELFKPLGISSAGFLQVVGDNPPTRAGQIDNPVGHDVQDEQIALRLDAHIGSAQTPAGGVYMSLPDLMKFLVAHLDGASLLEPDTWRMLHTDSYGGRYALGWEVETNGVITHYGSGNGFATQARISLLGGVAAAAVANSDADDVQRTIPLLQIRAASTTVTRLPVQGSPEAFTYAAEFVAAAEKAGIKLN